MDTIGAEVPVTSFTSEEEARREIAALAREQAALDGWVIRGDVDVRHFPGHLITDDDILLAQARGRLDASPEVLKQVGVWTWRAQAERAQ